MKDGHRAGLSHRPRSLVENPSYSTLSTLLATRVAHQSSIERRCRTGCGSKRCTVPGKAHRLRRLRRTCVDGAALGDRQRMRLSRASVDRLLDYGRCWGRSFGRSFGPTLGVAHGNSCVEARPGRTTVALGLRACPSGGNLACGCRRWQAAICPVADSTASRVGDFSPPPTRS